MSLVLHPEAQPIIDAFIANGGKSFEKMGEIPALRTTYEGNCALAAMQSLEHIQSQDICVLVSEQPVNLRIYDTKIEQAEKRPAVLFIHGGGWVIGNLNTHDSICRKISATANVRVIAVDYRLSPEAKFPIPFEDCQRALQYIMEHADDLNVDVRRMVFAGDSAGANLAAHLGQNFYQNYGVELRAQVLLYPVIGHFPELNSYQRYQDGLPLVESTMNWFFAQLFAEGQDRDAISLLNQPFTAKNGDIFLLTLEHDPLCDEALLYLQRAIQSGLNVEYHHLKGLMHGIFTLAGKLPVAEQYLVQIGKYIASKI